MPLPIIMGNRNRKESEDWCMHTITGTTDEGRYWNIFAIKERPRRPGGAQGPFHQHYRNLVLQCVDFVGDPVARGLVGRVCHQQRGVGVHLRHRQMLSSP